MSLAAIILAAGASSRMGRPKPLLEYRGETFLDRLIGMFAERCSPVVVVLGSRAEEIRSGCRRRAEAEFVVNSEWPLGMLGSLKTGLRSLPQEIDGFAFTPVDSPRVAPSTMAILAARFEESRPPLVIPGFQGRRGHPVVCASTLIPEFLGLPAGAQARDVVHRYLEDACFVDVDDPAILEDIDDPEAYRKLTEPVEAK